VGLVEHSTQFKMRLLVRKMVAAQFPLDLGPKERPLGAPVGVAVGLTKAVLGSRM
jgi:hypothetical protein